MKYLHIILIAALFTSCAKTITPPSDIPNNPKVEESARPAIRGTQDNIDKGINENTQQQGKVDETVAALLEQKMEISEALAQAEKIKEKALAKVAITELEAINLVNQVKKVEARNLFLETKVNELDGLTKQQAKTLTDAKKLAADALEKSDKKDGEAREAQEKLSQVKVSLNTKNAEVSNLMEKISKQDKELASASVYKNWVIGLVVGFILWTIIKNVLMNMYPATRFRI